MFTAIYKTPQEMQQKLENYFADKDNFPFTITGISLALGFSSTKTFYNYLKKPEFKDILGQAHLKVQNVHEKRLFASEGSVTGSIFALKCMGWRDTPQDDDINDNLVKPLDAQEQYDFIRRFKEDY